MRKSNRTTAKEIRKVVSSGNCSGCGVCASLSPEVAMEYDDDGYQRPVVSGSSVSVLTPALFRQFCPGVSLSAPIADGAVDPIFGRYVSMWSGRASDDHARNAGSSAGVLTALSGWWIDQEKGRRVAAAQGASDGSGKTIPIELTSKEDALRSAGARYAPVAVGALVNPNDDTQSIVGKPCEVAAVVRARTSSGEGPLRFSFFCAGTPSQRATDSLVESAKEHGVPQSVRYRGDGWPGRFVVSSAAAPLLSMDYRTSWSSHLGPAIQWRCKVCPDGTGEYADVAVGDYWATDAQGYPVLEEAEPNSVVIARTARGHESLMQAVADGVIELDVIDRKRLQSSQPSQVLRRRSLGGRILGAMLAGRRVPRYEGYGLLRIILGSPILTFRAAIGTWRRIRSGRTGSL